MKKNCRNNKKHIIYLTNNRTGIHCNKNRHIRIVCTFDRGESGIGAALSS